VKANMLVCVETSNVEYRDKVSEQFAVEFMLLAKASHLQLISVHLMPN
jgi:hypothetical protein